MTTITLINSTWHLPSFSNPCRHFHLILDSSLMISPLTIISGLSDVGYHAPILNSPAYSSFHLQPMSSPSFLPMTSQRMRDYHGGQSLGSISSSHNHSSHDIWRNEMDTQYSLNPFSPHPPIRLYPSRINCKSIFFTYPFSLILFSSLTSDYSWYFQMHLTIIWFSNEIKNAGISE